MANTGPTFDPAVASALGPIRAPQLYEQIADRLRDRVLGGALAPGSRLPSERELARMLEVSRSSVREAVAALQLEGVVETRPGTGSFIAPDAAAILLRRVDDEFARTAAHAADVSPSALLEARALLEPAVARLAAVRAQPDRLAEDLLARMEASEAPSSPLARAGWNDADRLFHRQLASMTGNPVLIAIADHVAQLMNEPLWQRLRDEAIAVSGRMALHAAEHRMIYDAVVRGDAQASEFYASEHIRRVRRYMSLD
jgi:DNA-binding FadR family transcriptional regulator